MKIERNCFIYFLGFFCVGLMEWIFGIILTNNVNVLDYSFIMPIYEWLIILTVIVTVCSWKKIQGYYLSPFTILYAFLIVFNAGQFIMWGWGIHYITRLSSELGVSTHIRFMDPQTLMKVIFITLPALTFFYAGVLLAMSKKKMNCLVIEEYENIAWQQLLKQIGVVILVVSYVTVMCDTISNAHIVASTGYTSLYYGDIAEGNVLLKYIGYMFFPSFFATYVGFKCTKKAYIVLTLISLPYILINLIIGDRGSWIYFICLWAWCYFRFYSSKDANEIAEKRKKKKRILKCAVLAVIVLFFTTVFYKYRDIGFENITSDSFKEVMSDLSYVFIKPIFEMGQSARCLGIVIQDDLDKMWEGGNTYLAGIASMILPRIKRFFGFYDGYLENWFSQTHMGIKNYGLGFTAVAEAYLNGGQLLYPFYIMLFGFFVGKITKYEENNAHINYKSLYFVTASTVTIITACRGSIELSLRKWFYGCLLMYIAINIFISTYYRRKKM